MKKIKALENIPHRIRGKTATLMVYNKAFFGSKPYLINVKLEREDTNIELAQAIKLHRHIVSELEAGRVPIECDDKHQDYVNTLSMSLHELMKLRIAEAKISVMDMHFFNADMTRIRNIPITAIDPDWIRGFIQDQKIVFNSKPGTIKKRISAYKRLFKWAQKHGHISVPNPFIVYEADSEDFEYTPADESLGAIPVFDVRRDLRFREGDEEKFLTYFNGSCETGLKFRAAMRFIFKLGLETGVRMREMYLSSVKDFDVKARTLHLPAHITKNGKSRNIPLNTRAIQAYFEYREHVMAQSEGTEGFHFDNDKLFQFYRGDQSDQPVGTIAQRKRKLALGRVTSDISSAFKKVTKAIGYQEFRFHDVRHEALSRMGDSGLFNEMQLMAISGHSSSGQLKPYLKLDDQKQADRMDRV